jgi:hypothetical protein
VRLGPLGQEGGNGDRRQYTDDGHDHQQLDEGEAAVAGVESGIALHGATFIRLRRTDLRVE